MKTERAMSDAADRRNDYGDTTRSKRSFTRWCKRQLSKACRRHNNNPVAWS